MGTLSRRARNTPIPSMRKRRSVRSPEKERPVMSEASQSNRASTFSVRASVLCPGLLLLIAAAACSPAAAPPPAQAAADADPRSDGAENVRLVGYQDLQGRQSLEVNTRSNAA